MDNLFGVLFVIAIVVAVVIWVVKMIFMVVAGAFVMLTGVFGHPLFVIGALGAIGAGVGMFQLGRRHGAYVARSSRDYATIKGLRLTPEQWGALVITVFIAALALYGMLFVRAHRQAVAVLGPATASAAA